MRPRSFLSFLSFGIVVATTGCGLALGLGDFTDEAGGGGAPSGSSNASSGKGVGGSATASSGTGTGGGCAQFDQKPCYDGPANTLQGACHAGKSTCGASGTYGPCLGEQLPAPTDDCKNMVDATCDGMLSCACTPGSMMQCYDGTPGTDMHPPCKGGTRTCLMDGSGYGACAGEVTPIPEDCSTPIDDDCDGTVNQFCTCQKGDMQSCYDGVPMATMGVGDCKAGTQACNATGTGWDACLNEVVPQPEDCTVDGDENCDGIACSDAIWSDLFLINDQQGVQGSEGIAVDTSGNIALRGDYYTSIDFGNGVTDSAVASFGSFLTKLDGAGKAKWSVGSTLVAPAFDPAGNVYVATGPLASLASYDPAGNLRWIKHYGGTGSTLITGVAVDSSSIVAVTGSFNGTLVMGNTLSTPGIDAFVAKVDPNSGTPFWGAQLSGGDSQGSRVACDFAGNVYAFGSFGGTLKAGANSFPSVGAIDIFLAKFGFQTGNLVWAAAWGSPGNDFPSGVGVDPAGNPVIAGFVGGSIDLGGGVLIGSGGFVAKYASSNVAPQWSKLFAGSPYVESLAVDSAGNVLLAGNAGAATLNFGGPALTNKNGAFLAKLDPSAKFLWNKSFGGGSVDNVVVGVDPTTSDVVLSFYTNDVTDLGLGPVDPKGMDSIVLGKFQP